MSTYCQGAAQTKGKGASRDVSHLCSFGGNADGWGGDNNGDDDDDNMGHDEIANVNTAHNKDTVASMVLDGAENQQPNTSAAAEQSQVRQSSCILMLTAGCCLRAFSFCHPAVHGVHEAEHISGAKSHVLMSAGQITGTRGGSACAG